ncbi:hypothetical protein SynA1524_02030 [Synechococcus sp. A15-24]|nr:hypothetical protein SynA1524_02030 [Synechococcus sp. A15-24]
MSSSGRLLSDLALFSSSSPTSIVAINSTELWPCIPALTSDQSK